MSYWWWQFVRFVSFSSDSSIHFQSVLLALWLDHAKTLRQQEIDEQATLILRRKYFFSDTNIDQRDPVQLNLLYIQVEWSRWMKKVSIACRMIDSVEMEFLMELIPWPMRKPFNSLVYNVKFNMAIIKSRNTKLIYSSKKSNEQTSLMALVFLTPSFNRWENHLSERTSVLSL